MVSLSTLPSEVLSEIVLAALLSGSGVPTTADLSDIIPLVITCRNIHYSLCMANNPDLYAQIFRLMFDLEAVRRRLGASAVVSSVLALELRHRVVMLNAIQAGSMNTVAVLARAYLAMLENCGKNRYQLDFVQIHCFLNDLLAPAMNSSNVEMGVLARDPVLGLGLALMWLTSSTESLVREGSARHMQILDFLEPFVLKESEVSYTCAEVSLPVLQLDYFGRIFYFNVPSITVLARLCTVDRYNAYLISTDESTELCTLPSVSSTRYDADWLQFLASSQPVFTGNPRLNPVRLFEGNWEGNLLTPYPIEPYPKVVTCAQPMQCCIREYHSFTVNASVSFVEDEGDSEEALARAWFPEGVHFHETPEFLMVYDPINSRWLRYTPCSDAEKCSEGKIAYDTIFIGHTDLTHGARFGEYNFHGRMRARDGYLALVRTMVRSESTGVNEANTQTSDQGCWILHGHIYGGMEFVGDWRAVSTTNPTPGRKGWVHLARIKISEGNED